MASLDIVFSPKIAKPDVTSDELTGAASLLRKIAEDLSEMKSDISEIKKDILGTKNCTSSTYDTAEHLKRMVETIEHVTTVTYKGVKRSCHLLHQNHFRIHQNLKLE